jgi:carboxyl-terminal processing protease
MNSKSITGFFLIFICLTSFAAGYAMGQSPWAPYTLFGPVRSTPDEAREAFAPFWEVWSLVNTRYFDQPVDNDLLAEGAINGMLAVLGDNNTRYLAPEDEEAAREAMSGEFQGIGAEVTTVDGAIVVVSPIEGSPAEQAGLRPGDILREANGVALTGLDVVQAARLVRGPAGTAVSLLVEREGEQFNLEVVRARIELKSVRSEMLPDNLAYIRLNRFGERSDEEVAEALEAVMANNPAGLILDLRRNPGGSLPTAVAVADQFLPAGVILREKFGNGAERLYESTDRGLAQDVPLVVLIDEGSASASEVLAGAVRDLGRGTLIGQTTFGKGTVQTWQGLSNGGGVRLTIARWLTPDSDWIHERGLDPDFFIPLPQDELANEGPDSQLQAAIDFLTGKTIISIPPETEG